MADKVPGLRIAKRGEQAPKIHKTHKLEVAEWIESRRWVNVKSSNLQAICYDLRWRRLYIQFKSGVVWEYDVSPRIAAELFMSSSLGKYLHYRIKLPRYPARMSSHHRGSVSG